MFWKDKSPDSHLILEKLSSIEKLIQLHDRQIQVLTQSVSKLTNLKIEYDFEITNKLNTHADLYKEHILAIQHMIEIIGATARKVNAQ